MTAGGLPAAADVLVIGAGLVGAACAHALAAAGREVCVIDRLGPVAGTTAGGEGNILVSDKLPGPEARLALRSIALWRELASRAADTFEFEQKGGLVVARAWQLPALRSLAREQAAHGIEAEFLDAAALLAAEPEISPCLAGGVRYPQDCQVQPMLAAAWLLAEATRLGARTAWGAEVLSGEHDRAGTLTAVVTSRGPIAVGAVVNAAGPWGGLVAERLGGWLPVRPRRGHILVTEPLPPLVRHKVYESDYVGTVISDSEAAQCSAVVEGTKAGTVLIGSSREFAGWDRQPSLRALAGIAARARALFPRLADVRVMRCYVGFRPASPDHLPLIGQDTRIGGLIHACGHEGAGIGLAPATAEAVTALLTAAECPVDPVPFAPARLDRGLPAGEVPA